jgi:hypothetical protein
MQAPCRQLRTHRFIQAANDNATIKGGMRIPIVGSISGEQQRSPQTA